MQATLPNLGSLELKLDGGDEAILGRAISSKWGTRGELFCIESFANSQDSPQEILDSDLS